MSGNPFPAIHASRAEHHIFERCTEAAQGVTRVNVAEKAPLLVQYWMPRLKAVEAWAVGPPWILISSGGFSPGGSWKS